MGKRKLKEIGGSSKRYIRNTADIPTLSEITSVEINISCEKNEELNYE